jgi:5-methylcytosine-specific restriction endonuclease McrA
VKALLLQRAGRDERKLKSAQSLMKGEKSGRPSRAPIPPEVVRAVVERDGRRCVQCARSSSSTTSCRSRCGGAASVENLQILCGDCNRAKSDAL